MTYLAMVETNGNQAYIFATQRQRDHIGASWLLKQVPQWYEEFIDHHLKESGSRPVAITRTSGKIIVRFAERADAREFITWMTSQAAARAPGMDMCGTFIEIQGPHATQDEIASLHETLSVFNQQRLAPTARFPVTPLSAPCTDSAFPASEALEGEKLGITGREELAEAVRVKRHFATRGRESILDIVRDYRVGDDSAILRAWRTAEWSDSLFDHLVPHLFDLETLINDDAESTRSGAESDEGIRPAADGYSAKPLSWVGVIHADANSMGAVFANLEESFWQAAEADDALFDRFMPDGDHLDTEAFSYEVSEELEEATRKAFANSWTETLRAAAHDYGRGVYGDARMPPVIPVVPVLLGGDDVTVVTDGRYALTFASAYLRHFERVTARSPLLRRLVDGRRGDGGENAGEPSGLAAAAGVAIVKTNFPFYDAYQMAEHLCSQAKSASRAIPMLDFDVHYDSAAMDMAEKRAQYASVSARPLYVTEDRFAAAEFTTLRSWDHLVRAAALSREASGEAALSASQRAAVRQVLLTDEETAVNRWELLHSRARRAGSTAVIDAMSGPESSLYWTETASGAHGGAIARPWKNGTSRESRHCLLLDVMHLNDVSSPFIPTDDLTMNDNGEQSERHET